MTANNGLTLVNNERDLREILKEKNKMIVLFYATWCPFCVSFLPIFESAAKKKPLYFLLAKDNQEKIADEYSVTVYPSVIYFENGTISKRLDGKLRVGLNEKQLSDFIDSCLLP